MGDRIWGQIRTIALIVMIVSAVVADVILYLCKQWVWASFWSVIIFLVLVYELATYLLQRKTISTLWKEWTEKSPVIAYVTLTILWVALTALCVHLGCF